MTHVGERMKLLNCVSQDMKALAKILASAPRAVSKYRANVPDHLSGHCKMAAGSGLGTRLPLVRVLLIGSHFLYSGRGLNHVHC